MTNVLSPNPGAGFDIGRGVMMPDPAILRSGRVAADSFWSEAQHEGEREAIYRRCWLYVVREEEVAAPGDYVIRDVEICGVSVLIVRGKDAVLRAFHNVCRHRGMPVANGTCGKAEGFRCPYHSWTFNLDGSLKAIPNQSRFPGLDPSDLGLVPIALDVFAGFVFINLEPQPAMSLTAFLGGIAPLLEATTLAPFSHRDTLSAEVPANWKAGLDPQYEGYHVGTVHALTIREISVTPANPFSEFRKIAFAGPHAAGWSQGNPDWRPRTDRIVQSLAVQTMAALAKRVAGEGYPGAETPASLAIFPNFMIHPGAGGWFTQQHWPLAPQSHRWTAHYYYHPPVTASERLALAQATIFGRDSGMEDFMVMARQQKGLASGATDSFYYGEAEMLPRHRAAIIRSVLDGAQITTRSAA
jgi:phenylpropionate dioxygenase-like ring-hydroxylating dioxygenase large terminal subunit